MNHIVLEKKTFSYSEDEQVQVPREMTHVVEDSVVPKGYHWERTLNQGFIYCWEAYLAFIEHVKQK